MLVGVVKFKPSLHNFLLRVHLFNSSSFSLTLTRKRLVANEIFLSFYLYVSIYGAQK